MLYKYFFNQNAMKKILTLSLVALLATSLCSPLAFAKSAKSTDGEVDYSSESDLSKTELGDCKHYAMGEEDDEDQEYGFYDCDEDNDYRDLEDFFSKSDIQDFIDFYSDKYDYYGSSDGSYRSTTTTPNYTYRSTTYGNTAAPAVNTKVCTYTPTADGLGQFLTCNSLNGKSAPQNYAYYDRSKLPTINPYPSYVPMVGYQTLPTYYY